MKFLLLMAVLMAFFPLAYGQGGGLYLGPALSLQHEMAGGGGDFWGGGLRLQKRIMKNWEWNAGIIAVNRHYQSMEAINLCALQPGVFCPIARYQVESYGYRNIEVPLGINRYLLLGRQWEVYFHINFLSSFHYQSYYGTMRPRENNIKYFGSSLIGGAGANYRLSDKMRVGFEPFLRAVHHRGKDPVLVNSIENSYFDNYGINLMVLFKW